MDRLSRCLFVGALVVWLGGCAVVGPEYEPPDPALPEAYNAPVPSLFAGTKAEPVWWRYLGDATLNELIQQGLEANLDIREAASRLREARRTAEGVVAGTGPSLDAFGEAGVESRYVSGGDSDDDDTETSGSVTAGLDGRWEIDLFGGLSRQREAARSRVVRQTALRDEARRVTVGEIARTYVELRATERRLALIEQSLELQKRTLFLVEKRVDAGLAPALDRVRAQAEVASLEAEVGPLRTQAVRFRNALAVLLAEPPGVLDEQLQGGIADIPGSDTGEAVGVPADLVRRRPDVRAAEQQIAVATAEVGVAAAELYPRLTLPGSVSVGWSGIGDGDVVTTVLASLSALVEFPLYDGGRREAERSAAEERLVQASVNYRRTVLEALEEVESALTGYQGAWESRAAWREAVKNNRQAYEQSRELYRQGFVTFIDVIDSQRNWNDALQSLANAERDVSLAVVNLYTALGVTDEGEAVTTQRADGS